MPSRGCARWIVLAATCSSCASVPKESGFGDVQADVRARTGLEIQWNQLTPADAEASSKLRELLSDELSADRAVQIALLNNRDLQAVYEELGIAQADLVAAGLLKNPVFNAEVRFPEGGGQVDLDLSVAQEFLGIFMLPLRRRIASARFEEAKLRVTGEVLDLAGEVRAAFFVHEGAQQLHAVRATAFEATGASLELAERLHEAGNLRDLDLANERALHEQSRLDVAAAELAVVEARERLNSLLGLWGEATRWHSSGKLPDVPAAPLEIDGLEGSAVERSLELGLARAEIERVAVELGLARSTRLAGELELGVSAERDDGTWSIGPTAALPIPLFDQGQPAIARANAKLRQLQEQYAASAIAIRSEVRAVASRISLLQAQERYYRAVLLPLRQQILDDTQREYNAMQIGAFQLLQAKQQEIEAGSKYVETLRDYWIASTALGQLAAGRRSSTAVARSAGSLERSERRDEGHATGAEQ